MSGLPSRTRPGTSRTVWVEIDEDELDEVRIALRVRIESLEGWREEWSHGGDAEEIASRQIGYARAVLARIPDAAAMRRRYP